jgi:hypothetical protein
LQSFGKQVNLVVNLLACLLSKFLLRGLGTLTCCAKLHKSGMLPFLIDEVVHLPVLLPRAVLQGLDGICTRITAVLVSSSLKWLCCLDAAPHIFLQARVLVVSTCQLRALAHLALANGQPQQCKPHMQHHTQTTFLKTFIC